MHIYAQRPGKRSSVSPTNLGKSRSLQSLNDTSPRMQNKINGQEKKRRDQQEREKKSKFKQRSTSNDVPSKVEKKKPLPSSTTTNKNSSNDDKTDNGNVFIKLFYTESVDLICFVLFAVSNEKLW